MTAAQIGASMRRRRERQDLKQAEVAQRIGISRTLLSRWESGDLVCDVVQFMAWCEALDLRMDVIAG